MILEIYILFSVLAIGLFVAGMIELRVNNKFNMLFISFLFLIVVAINSFNIVKVGFGDSAVLTHTFKNLQLALFYSFLAVLNAAMILLEIFVKSDERIHGRPNI